MSMGYGSLLCVFILSHLALSQVLMCIFYVQRSMKAIKIQNAITMGLYTSKYSDVVGVRRSDINPFPIWPEQFYARN